MLPNRPAALRNATLDDVADLSAIRGACFDKLWIESTFAEMLQRPKIICLIAPGVAYAMVQKIPPEAEIITIAVSPEHRRQGIAEHMLREICARLSAEGITTLHLEVSEKLIAAQKLYAKIGFAPSGRRAGYYLSSSGERADAILMQLSLRA
jgi:ribosomal-protein-alanine N-acetyltransferase